LGISLLKLSRKGDYTKAQVKINVITSNQGHIGHPPPSFGQKAALEGCKNLCSNHLC
jgi:hypothetical protein